MGFQKRCEHELMRCGRIGFGNGGRDCAFGLLEALYRGAMVLEGHPYHNE